MRPHRRQPTRLPCPWDSPAKNTGVGCHFLLQCVKVKSESEVAQSCRLLATPCTAAYQAPPSMGFSRQEYWSGVPLPSPPFSSTISHLLSLLQLFLPVHLRPAPISQLLYCATILFKVLYCKIKNVFLIFCLFFNVLFV